MKGWLLGIVVLILLSIVASIGYILWRRRLKQTSGGVECTPSSSFMQCLKNGNQAGIESVYDSSVPSPATTLQIKYFSKTLGYPWCIPTRYALRYVNESGGYGPLSEWSDSVVASKKSDSGCSSNVPQLEVVNSNGLLNTYPIINVHRQRQNDEGDGWDEDELVGYLLPYINQYIDIDNPNMSGEIQRCKGC